MPCYEVRLTTVEFKAKHKDLLVKAAKELGWSVQEERGGSILSLGRGVIVIDLNNQQATYRPENQGAVNILKQKYSGEVLQAVAKAKRWGVQQKAKNKFVVRRYA